MVAIAIVVLAAGYGLVRLFGWGADESVHPPSLPLGSGVSANETPRDLRFAQGPADPSVPFVADMALVGLPGGRSVRLAERAAMPLAGWLSPVAVPSPDRRIMAYNSWRASTETPSLRLHDLQTGDDSLFEEGAFTLAWRRDGAIAYFRGIRRAYIPNELYVGHVMVRSSVDANATRWTRKPGRYKVVAWAKEHLIVYRELEGEYVDLLVLKGPGKVRVLAPGSFLVALSPDGARAFVSALEGGTASILRVPDGKELARIDLSETDDSVSGEPINWVGYGGSWVGDRIVADYGRGLLMFDVADGGLSIEQVLNLVPDPFPVGTYEPQFADAEGTRVVAWGPMSTDGGPYEYVDCDLVSLRCTRGAPQDVTNFSHAYNPSRPILGG